MSPPKAPESNGLETVEASWDAILLSATKRQRKDIRIVLPFFLQMGVRCEDVESSMLNEICRQLQDVDGQVLNKGMSAQRARWACNSCVHALNDLRDGLIALAPLAGPRDEAERRHEEFVASHGDTVQHYHASRIVEGRPLDAKSLTAELIAFKNCVNALESVGIIVDNLEDLVTPERRFDLMEALDSRGRRGSFVQAMRTLAGYALFCNHDDAEDAHEEFTAAARQYGTSQAMSSTQVERVIEFISRRQFKDLHDLLMREAQQDLIFEPISIRHNNRVTSAVCALIAIFTPASFKVIYDAEFLGPLTNGRGGARPTLKIPPHDGGFERCLSPRLVAMIDQLYWAYSDRGIAPIALMVDGRGAKRARCNAVASMETLLANLGLRLTPLDLREIGIGQALRAGDGPDQIARAARLSERAFWSRYHDFAHKLKQIKD